MFLPFYMHDAFSRPIGLVIATLIGCVFGFALERAGFGRATVLTDQFYGDNMRVFKVMFSAIVTAMLGVFIFSSMGILDLSLMRVPVTYLWPQIVGGFLLGVGFIVSGHCPGTAVVGASSGNIDAMVAVFGTAIGTLVFGIFYPWLQEFYSAGDMGVLRLPETLGVGETVAVVGVVVMAIGCFFGAEWIERKLARDNAPADPTNSGSPTSRNRVFGVWSLATVAGAVVLFSGFTFISRPQPSPSLPSISALELATTMVEDPTRFFILDARTPPPPPGKRVPGAMVMPPDDPAGDFLRNLPATRDLVIYAGGELDQASSITAKGFAGTSLALQGGYAAFEQAILTPPAPPAVPTPASLAGYRLQSALHAHFTGASAPAPPPAVKPVQIKRARKAEGGC
jgi:uncharacterized membrane protein YedE/YeeE